MAMRKWFDGYVGLVLCIVSLALVACGGKPVSPQSAEIPGDRLPKMKEGGSMVYGFATELNNFDPFSSMTAEARAVNFNIFDGLVNVATDGNFLPAIAESYAATPDFMSWTFTLRKGIKFHDGKALSKDDVLYSIQKAVDGGVTGYNKIESFSFDAGGEQLTIRLKGPDAGFIAYLTTPIVQKDAKDLALHPVGTGPFSLKEYVE